MKSVVPICCLLICLAGKARGADSPSTLPASLALPDLDGKLHYPLDMAGAPAAVIVFIGVDCPVSNSYAPLINRLAEQYEARHVKFFLIHSESNLSSNDARKHAKEYGYTRPTLLLDPKHLLSRQVSATVTPEAAVIGPDGKLCYRGRIDDLYISLGKPRYQASTHDLRDAIDAVLAGKPVLVERTTAIGCTIGD
ncbi:MAG TPA: redoxin family protein [Humisphaera sp.]|jgi:thiol-disulfide isomerase/thioredoxin|nr:redoxin family protein [Humisphaera sp.]